MAVIDDLVRSVQVLVRGAGWERELEEVTQKVTGQRSRRPDEGERVKPLMNGHIEGQESSPHIRSFPLSVYAFIRAKSSHVIKAV